MTDAPPARPARLAAFAGAAGVLGAAFAALCCMGAPVVVGALAAVGLAWLRRDAILWPLMFASLAVALWGLWAQRRRHRHGGPLVLGAAAAVALVAGVVFVHGLPARVLIYAAAVALVAASVWNAALRRSASRRAQSNSTRDAG